MTEYLSFYKASPAGGEGKRCMYPARLDTYGRGCQHNCGYCYARSLLDFRHMWDSRDPGVADIGKIREKIAELAETPGHPEVLRLGGMTDCFQPLERSKHVTYETIKALNDAGIGYLVVTKSALVADEAYLKIYDPKLAHFQVSVTSTDPERVKRVEPGAPPFEDRARAIETLAAAGFDTSIRLSPFVDYWVDPDKVNGIKCRKILVEFLRINHWTWEWLSEAEPDFPIRLYRLRVGGCNHLPLERKLAALSVIDRHKELSVCEDVPEHYEYWKTHVNVNPKDCCDLWVPPKDGAA